ncbi:MAG TPA: ribonucleoside-diphosphate reductase subunit alpha, partial [Cyclobacteriaceae bacterium]|nr:ribonucleoside-diphosphate reductase subunit alpha [Cyclobacteriaceae bacterium]
KGLKTGMYYLRSTAASDAIKFTIDKAAMQQPQAEVVSQEATVAEPAYAQQTIAGAVAKESQQAIRYETMPLAEVAAERDQQNRADMACSLDNPEGCEACGS